MDAPVSPASIPITPAAAAGALAATERAASESGSGSEAKGGNGDLHTPVQAPVQTPVLLYDGECGFCAGSIQFVLKHEADARRGALRFAPLQGVFGTMVRNRFPQVVGVDSVVWFDPSRSETGAVLLKSAAALAALAHVGGLWRPAAMLGMLVPRIMRDMVYDAIAKRRFTLAAPACLIPTADTRTRFLA